MTHDEIRARLVSPEPGDFHAGDPSVAAEEEAMGCLQEHLGRSFLVIGRNADAVIGIADVDRLDMLLARFHERGFSTSEVEVEGQTVRVFFPPE